MVQLFPICRLFGLFAILNICLLSPWILSPDAYERPVILLGALQELARPAGLRAAIRLVVACLTLGYLLYHFRALLVKWPVVETGRARVIVSVSAIMLAWKYSTYEYNYYFDQFHLADRCLLIVLSLAICWRPVFIFPFLFVLLPLLGQFSLPIGGYKWVEPSLPARILVLFGAMFLSGLATKEWHVPSFWFLLLCIFAGHYFPSGYAKLKAGWLVHDQIHFLLPNTYANGWLGFLQPTTIDLLANTLAFIEWPMKVFTVVVECGALFFLWRHATAKLFLISWIALHTGIWLVSGICFWPWVVTSASLLILMWSKPILLDSQRDAAHLAISILLIASSSIWLRSTALCWIDSPLTYSYRLTAIGESGDEYEVPPYMLAPYDAQFTMGSFAYLSSNPLLPLTWGATNLPTYREIRNVTSAIDVASVEQTIGSVRLDQKRVAQFKTFVRVFFHNRNEQGSTRVRPYWVCAPRFLWSFRRSAGNVLDERVAQVQVDQLTSGFVDGRYQEFRQRPVILIVIDESRGNE